MLGVCIDFETYYDPDTYSLKHMPMAQYVRDDRFRVLGAAVRVDGAEAAWLSADGPGLARFLASLREQRFCLVAHNAQFEGLILAEHYGLHAAQHICTMFMLRYLISQGLLPPEQSTALGAAAPLVGEAKGDIDAALRTNDLGTYAIGDVNICYALWEKYWRAVPPVEQDIIDMHVSLVARPGFHLDVPRLLRVMEQDAGRQDFFKSLRRDAVFAGMLEKLNVTPVWKVAKRGKKLATAKNDAFMRALHSHPDERVRVLAEMRARAASAIDRTRAARLVACKSPLPVPLLYYGAHTGRSSGRDMLNPQNLRRGGELRRALLPPPGHKLVIVDSAQIEARVLAWLAQETDLLAMFAQGVDVYREFAASSLYGGTPDAVSAAQRQVAKAAVLQLGFGAGAQGFWNYCQRAGLTDVDAEGANFIVDAYRRRFPRIVRFWDTIFRAAQQDGSITLPSGRRLVYSGLRMTPEGRPEWTRPRIFQKSKTFVSEQLWRGRVAENVVQAVARDVVFSQAVALRRRGLWLGLMSHDDSVFFAPESAVERAAALASKAFETSPGWAKGLPLRGEVRVMETLGGEPA